MHRFYALSLIFSISCFAHGQTQNWLWGRGAFQPDTGASCGKSVCIDPKGNIFVTGAYNNSSISFGSTTLTNVVSGDYYYYNILLLKYDPAGNLIWAKQIGGANDDVSFSVCTDASGNVFVTGMFASPSIAFGNTTLTPNGMWDFFVAKFDNDGNPIWAKSAGGSNNDEGRSVCTDKNGNAIVTGWFWSPSITFGSTTLTNNGNLNMFIVKYDGNGNVLWAKSPGGINDAVGCAVCTDSAGDIFASGFFSCPVITFGTFTCTNNGFEDFFLVKYDPSGNELWAKSAGGSGQEEGMAVSADKSGNAVVTGWFGSSMMSFGNYVLSSVGYPDLFIAKYDASGNVLWAKGAGGMYEDMGSSVSTCTDGSIYAMGIFKSASLIFDADTLVNPDPGNAASAYIVKFDSSGNTLCASSLTNGGENMFDGTSADRFGNVYLTEDTLIRFWWARIHCHQGRVPISTL